MASESRLLHSAHYSLATNYRAPAIDFRLVDVVLSWRLGTGLLCGEESRHTILSKAFENLSSERDNP